jgi:histidine triad (HIT) family protein
MDCLFCKIVEGKIPSQSVHSDEHCYAFADVNPQAPVHFLVVPREHIPSIAHAGRHHQEILGTLMLTAADIARSQGLDHGYRVVINAGAHAGQSVDHLHVHVLGGRPLSWPPG